MRARAAAVALVAALGLTGCTGPGGRPAADRDRAAGVADPAGGAAEAGELSGTLTVLAAASLTEVFGEFGERLTDAHPDLDVRFSFAGSSALAAQLLEGAPADVFAAADERQMQRVQDADVIGEAEIFAENVLMVVVPADNPRGVAPPEGASPPRLAELISPDMTVAVCAPEVPCGAAAAELLEASGLSDAPDTYEEDVRAVLTKVQLGEVDAGLVYLSDVHAAGDTVLAYAFWEAPVAANRYPVGALADSANPAAARAFVDLVLSEEGQRVLADAGFLPPS